MRTIIITGCSNGIGNHLINSLKDKYNCIGVDVEPCDIKNTYQVDITDYAMLKNILGPIGYKTVDAIINCTGICQRHKFQEFTDYSYMFNCNVVTVLNMCKHFLPNLTVSKGCIINISSIHAMGTLEDYSIYAMTKGGVESLTKGLAVELSCHDIRVNCIRLGPVRTGMLLFDKDEVERIPLGRLVNKDDIVSLVELLMSNRSITGSIISLDCGITSKLSVEM